MDDRLTYSHDGYTYTPEYHDEDDCRKIWHDVRHPGGERHGIPHTPYEHMSGTAFQTYVAMGCPRRVSDWFPRRSNFDNYLFDLVRETADRHGINIADPAQHVMLRAAMKLSGIANA